MNIRRRIWVRLAASAVGFVGMGVGFAWPTPAIQTIPFPMAPSCDPTGADLWRICPVWPDDAKPAAVPGGPIDAGSVPPLVRF